MLLHLSVFGDHLTKYSGFGQIFKKSRQSDEKLEKKSLFSEFVCFYFYQFLFHRRDSAQSFLSRWCLPFYGNLHITEVSVKVRISDSACSMEL